MKKFNINIPVGFRDYFLQDMAKKNKMESMLSVGSVHIKKQVKNESERGVEIKIESSLS